MPIIQSPSLISQCLQRVQNSLARVVVPSVKYSEHISPVLRKLHWLPIAQRIKYKIASITFKTLQDKQPSYLLDLLHPYTPSRTLRTSDQHLLSIPYTKFAIGQRAFQYAAPIVWKRASLLALF